MEYNIGLILKTVLVGLISLVIYGVVKFYFHVKRSEKVLEGLKTPPYHWLLGSFRYVCMAKCK